MKEKQKKKGSLNYRELRRLENKKKAEKDEARMKEMYDKGNGTRIPRNQEDLNLILNLKAPTLYVIQCDKYYKIGHTYGKLKDRIDTLKIGNPLDIDLYVAFRTRDCRLLEGFLHDFFKDKRVSGEWFSLSSEDLYVIERSIGNVFQWQIEKVNGKSATHN